MAKMMNWRKTEKRLREKRLWIFGPRDLMRLFGASRTAAAFFVYRNTRRKLLVRLKKSRKESLYALADHLPDQYIIANRLYEPSYISMDAALSFHKIIPETIYPVTSVTTKATRQFTVANTIYSYSRIKIDVYMGYRAVKYSGATVLMADPEKALADYLYFIDLGKRTFQYERLDLKKIRKRKLLEYLKLYRRKGIIKLTEQIYAECRRPKKLY